MQWFADYSGTAAARAQARSLVRKAGGSRQDVEDALQNWWVGLRLTMDRYASDGRTLDITNEDDARRYAYGALRYIVAPAGWSASPLDDADEFGRPDHGIQVAIDASEVRHRLAEQLGAIGAGGRSDRSVTCIELALIVIDLALGDRSTDPENEPAGGTDELDRLLWEALRIRRLFDVAESRGAAERKRKERYRDCTWALLAEHFTALGYGENPTMESL